MFSASVGGQISWLIPSAFILLAVGLFLRGRAPRTDARRAAYVVWGGWLLVTMVTFSLMAGIFHEYYTVALAPAIAALVGMGAAEAWEHRAKADRLDHPRGCDGCRCDLVVHPPVAHRLAELAARSASSSSVSRAPACSSPSPSCTGGSCPSSSPGRSSRPLPGPAAYSVADRRHGPHRLDRDRGPVHRTRWSRRRWRYAGRWPRPDGRTVPSRGTGTPPAPVPAVAWAVCWTPRRPTTEVVSALSADASSYRWVAAAIGSQNAAGLQLGTGLPVMAIGGFNGSDPSPTLAQFQQYVADGDIHYLAGGGGVPGAGGAGGPGGTLRGGPGGGAGFAGTGTQISAWVAANFTQVTIGGSTFYDLTQPLTSAGTTATGTTTQTT